MDIRMKPIGEIITPYHDKAPYQPPAGKGDGDFYLQLLPEYAEGLKDLDSFHYIYVLFYAHRSESGAMLVRPPWAHGQQTGLFASRSPNRPNKIALSIVRVQGITDNRVYISAIDAFNHSPLLDIKPYIKGLDNPEDANAGWLDDSKAIQHLEMHRKGIIHHH